MKTDREIFLAAAELVEMYQWQPIETAPKDGTYILVWGQDFDCAMTAQWSLLDINPNTTTFEHGWTAYGVIFEGLTHWMPMPEKPAALAQQQGEVERLREALTPSAATKAAYMGEFEFQSGAGITHCVPWSTIKEIMKAISDRAVLASEGGEG